MLRLKVNKRKNKDFDYNYLIITILSILLILLVIPDNSIFGSSIDWSTQHIIFPDYFRKLFYKTLNLFPSFALSIGAGQNIYNFSYYGLLNPLLLISYLLPFLSMKDYIITLNGIIFISTGLISYYFFKTKTTKKVAFLTTMFIIFSAPILFHLHKHFMFVNYLPFLFLALIGVDKYLEKGKMSLVAFSIFMIIMISYYYSIPSIIVICIYAVYRYLELNPTVNLKDFLKKGSLFLIPIIIAIVSASVLLLPTFYTLKTGRTTKLPTTTNIYFLSRLIPKFNVDAYLYSNYTMGLTIISVISVILGLLSKKKHNLFLSITLIVLLNIPIVVYLLNGNLYFRNKVFIPFIPIVCLLLYQFIEALLSKKIPQKNILIISIILVILSIITRYDNPAIYLDLLLFNITIYLYNTSKIKEKLTIFLLILIPIITFNVSNYNDTYVSVQNKNTELTTNIKKILSQEKDIVRFNNLNNTLQNINEIYEIGYNQNSVYSSVSNPLYTEFYKNIFKNALSYRNNLMLAQNNDILFQTFMGIKYIYSEDNAPVGYEKIAKNFYKNDNVLPLFYGTNKITNEEDFDKLSYPENIEKLLSGVVTKDKTNYTKSKITKKINLEATISKQENLTIKQKKDYLLIKSKENGKLILDLSSPLKDDILILNIELLNEQSCKEGDLRITINNISNVRTCKTWTYKNNNNIFHYVISSNNDLNSLVLKFNKGTYKIGNIETYKLNYKDISKVIDKQSTFIANKDKSLGDNIEGTIDMKESGYFVTSIPYDEGFKVFVDNKAVEKQIVNKSFLGFKLSKGNHNIKIVYKSPLQKEGLILSFLGLVSFVSLSIIERRK